MRLCDVLVFTMIIFINIIIIINKMIFGAFMHISFKLASSVARWAAATNK